MSRRDDDPGLDPAAAADLAVVDAALAGEPTDPDHAELAELALLLAGERPRIDDDFAEGLDARVADGFGRRRRRPRLPAWLGPLRLVPAPALGAAASLLVVVVIAAGVIQGGGPGSGGGDDAASPSSVGGGAAAEPPPALEAAPSSPREAAPDAVGAQPVPGPTDPVPPDPPDPADGRRDRLVERQASIDLETDADRLADAAARVQEIARARGGVVLSASVSAFADGGSAQLELRVASRRLEATLADIAEVADVTSRSNTEQDITGEAVPVESRLEDARAERGALFRLLGRADTVQETQAARARLRIVRDQIASLEADLRRLERRASFSTVAVSIDTSDGEEADPEGWPLREAADDALDVLEGTAGALLVAAAIALPLGLVAVGLWLPARAARRRRRERALDDAA